MTVAVEPVNVDPTEAVKLADVAPVAMVAEAGTVMFAPVRATFVPPVGAAPDMVTVQVVLVFLVRLVAVHCTDETSREFNVTVVLADEPFHVAVMVAL